MKAAIPLALALVATGAHSSCSSPEKAPAETAAVSDAAPADARLPEVRYYVIADT